MILPESIREDPEVQASWCVWKAADRVADESSDANRLEAIGASQGSLDRVMDLILARHPQSESLQARVDELIQSLGSSISPSLAKQAAFREAISAYGVPDGAP